MKYASPQAVRGRCLMHVHPPGGPHERGCARPVGHAGPCRGYPPPLAGCCNALPIFAGMGGHCTLPEDHDGPHAFAGGLP